MKIIISVISIAILMSLIACSGITIKPVQPCIVNTPTGNIEFNSLCEKLKLENKTSNICELREKHNIDPCYIHRSMEVISKEGLVLEGYTAEEFETWANSVKERIKAGLTYATLRSLMVSQFTKINKMLGAQILILGDMFLELPQNEIIPEADIIILTSSIDDLVKEVKELDIWL